MPELKPSASPMPEDAHKDVLFILDARLEDVRELKRYQWQSSYYAVLAIGGLIALSRLASQMNGLYRLALLFACLLTFAAWWLINRAIERDLARSRSLRKLGYEMLSDEVKKILDPDPVDRGGIYRVLRFVVAGASALGAITVALP